MQQVVANGTEGVALRSATDVPDNNQLQHVSEVLGADLDLSSIATSHAASEGDGMESLSFPYLFPTGYNPWASAMESSSAAPPQRTRRRLPGASLATSSRRIAKNVMSMEPGESGPARVKPKRFKLPRDTDAAHDDELIETMMEAADASDVVAELSSEPRSNQLGWLARKESDMLSEGSTTSTPLASSLPSPTTAWHYSYFQRGHGSSRTSPSNEQDESP